MKKPDRRVYKLGAILLSKTGEVVHINGEDQTMSTTDWDTPDYPSIDATYAASIADEAINKMMKSKQG